MQRSHFILLFSMLLYHRDYNSSTYLLCFQKSKHVFGSGMQTEKACSMSPTTLLDLKESLEGLLKQGAR